jgi:hypothetical protein
MIRKEKTAELFSDYSYVTFASSAVLFAVGVITVNLPLLLVSSILLFSSMDALGYFHLVWGGDQTVPANNQEQRLISYRFIQTVFQALVTLILYVSAGVQYVLAFNAMWWFGLCDMLYYILLKQNFLEYKDMFWLWWTPAGILKSLGLIKDVTGVTMLIESILGIVVAGLILLL